MKILHHKKHQLWQQQKFTKQIQQWKKNLLTIIFKHTMGIYTHIDDIMSRDKHRICDLALLPLRVTQWRRKNMRWLAVIVVC